MDLNGKSILITGGAGFFGSFLTENGEVKPTNAGTPVLAQPPGGGKPDAPDLGAQKRSSEVYQI